VSVTLLESLDDSLLRWLQEWGWDQGTVGSRAVLEKFAVGAYSNCL